MFNSKLGERNTTHLNIIAIESTVNALNHLWPVAIATSTPAHAFQLQYKDVHKKCERLYEMKKIDLTTIIFSRHIHNKVVRLA